MSSARQLYLRSQPSHV
uniref:Uncharacterized protein n=1 Tax=Anguilla anguilla TaxID=7936 RepID=A0A0E9XJM6_ANGAN